MIDSISISGFRGIEKLEIKDLGRINVIIGRNDSGKTALMEALAVADGPHSALRVLQHLQKERARNVPTGDIDGFWRPLFFGQDTNAGMHLVSWRGPERSSVDITEVGSIEPISLGDSQVVNPTWQLNAISSKGDVLVKSQVFGSDGAEQAAFLVSYADPKILYWFDAGAGISEHAVQQFSSLKSKRRERKVVELLRQIDERLTRVEILAPRGQGQLYVELEGMPQMLPLSMMGQGFQRALDIAVCIAEAPVDILFIDEFENGLHHSILGTLWGWVTKISAQRNIQVFATTHSEECVLAAAASVASNEDNAFRVLRMARRAGAVVLSS